MNQLNAVINIAGPIVLLAALVVGVVLIIALDRQRQP